MKMNWLRNNRHLVVSFLWALASFRAGLGAMSRTSPWRFGPSLALLVLAVVFFLALKPKGLPGASNE